MSSSEIGVCVSSSGMGYVCPPLRPLTLGAQVPVESELGAQVHVVAVCVSSEIVVCVSSSEIWVCVSSSEIGVCVSSSGIGYVCPPLIHL